MSEGEITYVRTFLGIRGRNESLEYSYVPGDEPVIVGFTDKSDISALSFRANQALPPPKIQLSEHDAAAGLKWLIATVPLGSWAAFKWATPFRTTETLVVKAALRKDLLPGDFSFLSRRTVVLRVMAATGQPSQNAEPVVGEVGYEYAIDGIKLAKWLQAKLGGKEAADWLAKNHPTGAGLDKEDALAMISGSTYADREWYDLRQILFGAYRFTHLGVRRRR